MVVRGTTCTLAMGQVKDAAQFARNGNWVAALAEEGIKCAKTGAGVGTGPEAGFAYTAWSCTGEGAFTFRYNESNS
jgi:hypothetical protein